MDTELIVVVEVGSCELLGYFVVFCKVFECWFFNCFSNIFSCVSICMNDIQNLMFS